MSKQNEHHDTYTIPPNFIEGGTLFGGMFKIRNVIEAGIIAFAVGMPVFSIDISLTARIIILCLTALPLGLFALMGVNGEPLSSYIIAFFKWIGNRRVIGKVEPKKKKAKKEKKPEPPKPVKEAAENESMLSEIVGVIRKRSAHKEKKEQPKAEKPKKAPRRKMVESPFLNPVAEYLPIEKIDNGIIYTKDHRYIKIIEVIPINFLLRSAREQRSIIYSFISYLKICPVKIQFKVLTKRADLNKHTDIVRREMEAEQDPNCRMLQEDYLQLINRIGSREATTRRFFIAFEYEQYGRRGNEEADAIASLQIAARTAANYLKQCGNEVIVPENEDEFTVDVLYNILCRQISSDIPLPQRVQNIVSKYIAEGKDTNAIPCTEFFAPDKLDFTHGRYICVDGQYQSYLLIPSYGYKSRVSAGWLSLLVNAGDGIDIDLFLTRQPKERMVQKLGQQLRINRSKIREASDTNSDFDDLDGAIRSGYLLKEGLANNEDFYYMNILITITADTEEDLEWREREMRKLLVSQDLNIVNCAFREEQAFISALPLTNIEKHLYERSKRNVLTSGAASCYPFTAYELSDDNGILLGVNKYNNSLVIVDIFNSMVYKNANISIMGTSGAGKTFTLQLMALRMRRKGTQVFIIAPLKGHEFLRACRNTGGEFIQISPASKNCINVMEIRPTDRSVDELLDGTPIEKSELAAKIQQLHIFFSLLIPDMNHEERQLLDEALIKTYNGKGITHDNDSLEDPDNPGHYREMPILGDLYDILITTPETKRLANILNRLVHGSASTFNQRTNVNLDNKYTVLDISELSGDLLTAGMFVALDYVWDKAKQNRTVEKTIFIDECWALIGGSANRLAANFVLEIAKIIRGYGGSAVFATQDLNDFFALDDGKYGKGIINNCKTKIVLNLEDEEAQRVQSILHLSEAEVMEITHFERGNGLISTNNNNITVEFRCSDLEKSLITTDRRELQELVEQKKAAIPT
ncbi:MAG: TraM recognition domain-containing protein [Oscillospiraceae bacterium]|nr:TraM recognition domain-containing protein [Oscillospiraceae bacterium]